MKFAFIGNKPILTVGQHEYSLHRPGWESRKPPALNQFLRPLKTSEKVLDYLPVKVRRTVQETTLRQALAAEQAATMLMSPGLSAKETTEAATSTAITCANTSDIVQAIDAGVEKAASRPASHAGLAGDFRANAEKDTDAEKLSAASEHAGYFNDMQNRSPVLAESVDVKARTAPEPAPFGHVKAIQQRRAMLPNWATGIPEDSSKTSSSLRALSDSAVLSSSVPALLCRQNLVFLTSEPDRKPTLYFRNADCQSAARLRQEHKKGKKVKFNEGGSTRHFFFSTPADRLLFRNASLEAADSGQQIPAPESFGGSSEAFEGAHLMEVIEMEGFMKNLHLSAGTVSLNLTNFDNCTIEKIYREIRQAGD